MIVVVNASPLLALSQAQALFILKAMFGRVYIPDSVYRETVIDCNVPLQRRGIIAGLENFIEVATPNVNHAFTRNLGSGERGVLNLALERKADLVLMDDKKARNEAKALGFICAFTSDALKRADRLGLLSHMRVMEDLRGAGIYLP